ncbi:MAG: CPBP family intramembrane metalloprotease [Treponema sp.]|nr:CPBP family intramembrane metalloprotease [Treponema sp.]
MYLNVCVLAGSLRSGWLELRKRMEVKKSRFVLDSGAALVTFGLLCCIFALMQLALFLGFFPESRHVFYRPDSVGGWIYCLLGLFAAAFNEEALYRSILPFWASAGFAPRFRPVWECALVVSFALGHRYLGPQACLNAALAGAALRVCAIKRKSILPSFVAHSAYNLFLLVLETIL